MIQQAVAAYPNFKVAATTLRTVKSATRNDWGAICWADGKFYEAPCRPDSRSWTASAGVTASPAA